MPGWESILGTTSCERFLAPLSSSSIHPSIAPARLACLLRETGAAVAAEGGPAFQLNFLPSDGPRTDGQEVSSRLFPSRLVGRSVGRTKRNALRS